MGNWHISIEGVGIHHNYNPQDANVLAVEFVKALKAVGHQISKATFTYGGSQSLLTDAWHPEMKPKPPPPKPPIVDDPL